MSVDLDPAVAELATAARAWRAAVEAFHGACAAYKDAATTLPRQEIAPLSREATFSLAPVSARIVGPFGVHPSVNAPGFTVTHAQTGAGVAILANEARAVALAALLAEIGDWNFSDCRHAWRLPYAPGVAALIRFFLTEEEEQEDA